MALLAATQSAWVPSKLAVPFCGRQTPQHAHVQQPNLRRLLPSRPAASRPAAAAAAAAAAAPRPVRLEAEVPGMTEFLDRLKWDANGLVVAIAQHADTGEVLMQAFADRAAVCETLQTG